MIIKNKKFFEKYYKDEGNNSINKLFTEDIQAKNQWIISQIIKYPLESKIIDIGCQHGSLTIMLNMIGYNCVGFDLSEGHLKKAKENFIKCVGKAGTFIQGFAQDLDKYFKPKSFDILVQSSILEHLLEVDETCVIGKKLIKPDGQILSIIPHNETWYGGGHVTLFNDLEIKQHFPNAEINILSWKNKWSWYTIKEKI